MYLSGQPDPITAEMLMVFAIIGVVIFLFLVEWFRVDVVAILAMVSLPMLGLVTASEAFSGLSSNAVVSIIAVIIMGRGLDQTGVINRVVRPLVRWTGNRRSRIVLMLSVTIALISSVMQNIGAAALFLPALRRISRQSDIPLSQLLMPIGFSAILGGTITLVGSSPLIMLNDLLEPFQLAPFGLFSVVPLGLALVAVGITYFVLLGRWILPHRSDHRFARRSDLGLNDGPDDTDSAEDGIAQVTRYYEDLGDLHELLMPANMNDGPSVVEMCDAFQIHAVALALPDDGTTLIPPTRETRIPPGAAFAVYGTEENVRKAAYNYGFIVRPEPVRFAAALSNDVYGVVEAVVPPHSRFVGQSLSDIHFRHNHLVAPLAVYREEDTIYSGLGNQVLRPGDAVLFHGKWEIFQQFQRTRDLIFSHSLDHEVLRPQKSLFAVGCFGFSTLLVLFSGYNLSVCLMAGALGMVLTGVITIDEAYQGVDWRTIFLLAGLIPLGLATQKTGAAAWLAHTILGFIGSPSQLMLLFVVGLISTLFTLVVSNVGATVLLVPLVVNMAQTTGADPRLAALVVGIAASNSFLLPTHQVNALYMGPGRYTSKDFLKVGSPLSLIFLIVMTLVVYLFYL